MAQGEAWDKEKIVELLRYYFELGYNIHKACQRAEFPYSTFRTWYDDDKELRQKVKAWQGKPDVQARETIVRKIEDGDDIIARWWLERREKDEFSTRNEQVSVDDESTKEALEGIRDLIKKGQTNQNESQADTKTVQGGGEPPSDNAEV